MRGAPETLTEPEETDVEAGLASLPRSEKRELMTAEVRRGGRGWGFEWRADVPWSRPHLAVISEQPQTGPKKASPLSLADDWRQSRTAHILLFALIAGIIVPGDAATARVMAGNSIGTVWPPAGSYNLSQVRRFPCVSSIQL